MAKITDPAAHPIDLESVVDRYLAVWSEADLRSRQTAIADLWAPDGVEFVEGAQFPGHDELEARIAEAYREFVESGKYAVASANDAACHHDIVTFTIQLLSASGGDSEDLAWAARVFLVFDEENRIREDYQLTVKPLAS
jgi:ketosteroid isomerase-like protein